MTAEPTTTGEGVSQPAPTWRFPRQFWLANLMELCERAAYYGFFIVLTLYLTDIAGFSDRETGFVAGFFYAGLYLLPPFVGAVSDRIGFKKALLLAFGLLAVGYFFLGVFHSKPAVLFFLLLAMVGGSFIKPLITGTVAKTTDKVNRARAYSLFYWVVNVGSFSGKTVVPSIRQGVGLEYVNFFSAAMCVLALLVALFLFRPTEAVSERKSLRDVFRSLWSILTNGRLMALTVIVSGFWIIQAQMYATMPKYVIRLLGKSAKPEWLANVNPLAVVLCVVLVTQLMRKRAAVTSMLVGMLIMPFSAAAMAASTALESVTGSRVDLWLTELHPLTVMMIAATPLAFGTSPTVAVTFVPSSSKLMSLTRSGFELVWLNSRSPRSVSTSFTSRTRARGTSSSVVWFAIVPRVGASGTLLTVSTNSSVSVLKASVARMVMMLVPTASLFAFGTS